MLSVQNRDQSRKRAIFAKQNGHYRKNAFDMQYLFGDTVFLIKKPYLDTITGIKV